MITIIIDNTILEKYREYYFDIHKKARKFPIKSPIAPSLNHWMILNRIVMNSEKQKWKEFGVWLIKYYKLENKNIDKCIIEITYFFGTKHRHDSDNYTPKFLFDSFTKTNLLVDDDFEHVTELRIKGSYDKTNPRTEIKILECQET